MTNAVATREGLAPVIEQVLMQGNLSQLTPEQRVEYYNRVCESIGLNPLTRPFEYITLNGKLTLYARKDATDQVRQLKGISVQIVSREMNNEAGIYVVTARATTPDGRTDESIGAVTVSKQTGEALANALMKCETKAKRRVTLSIAGLGFLDETEMEDIPEREKRAPVAAPVARSAAIAAPVDTETGEIYGWTLDELRDAVKASGMATSDLAPELGLDKLTTRNVEGAVNGWLLDHPGQDIHALVDAAAARLHVEAPAMLALETDEREPETAEPRGLH